ncbi:MAG: glycosyltransferase 87 family protein [Corynebacterium flavescens]|uniref:glycosyltransferase 87 family protein n=1 Tax=Corynebacterium flavescens TaxID=28028 RepID=UPI002649D444|nr:glycosyltransferase 87 family protein [Corynebacterium flavescens]MDN6553007.1 glycosyltransferase 87 family protein [Corynebacterium flavescens]
MKKLYGTPTLVILLSALVAVVFYRFTIYSGNYNAMAWIVPFDLSIYRLAGQDVAHGGLLYDGPYIDNFPFTYPPFAAVIFEQMASWSDNLIISVWQGGIFVCLLIIILMIFRERGLRLSPLAILVAILLTAATPANEPIHGTLFYGQINVLLMLLVALDILPHKWRLPGIGIGLAAGLTLTPAYMGLVLLFQRRWWAAGISVVTFIVTVVLGFLFIPDAKVFWTDAMFNSSRVGDHDNTGAKSLRSLMYRVWGIDGGWKWLLAVLVVFILTCLALRTAYKLRNNSAALTVAGLSSCLVSPFAWYHHFVWTIPLGIVVFIAVNQAVGDRLHSVWGAQLAGLLSFAALILIQLPFVSAPVWEQLSSRGLDSTTFLHPWLSTIFTATCLVAIAVYAAWGFIPRKAAAKSSVPAAS